jgi:CubicO group peptidase (beta-lactamase class C family)
MIRNIQTFICIFFLLVFIAFSGCKKDDLPPGPIFNSLDEEIDSIAAKYVKVGAMVGVIDRQQARRIFSYGSKSGAVNDPPDDNTVFDIGSVTKTFTAIIAADFYTKGLIQDDTVAHYLPADQVTMPTKGGVEITFLHLLTHTSGIPRTPHEEGSSYPRPPGYDAENPYAAYTTEQVYDYLSNYCTFEFTPGTWWAYSNTAVGLAGHVLGIIDGTSYETVLTRDVFDELGMDHSSLFLTEDQSLNLALGHDSYNKVVPFYTANDIFQGCGMIKSTLNDMFKYLEANMGLSETPLRSAMDLSYQIVMHQGSMGDQALAWWILDLDDGQRIIYSGGNTNGHSAYIAFNQKELTGAILLFNASNHDGSNLNMGMEVMKAIMKY